MTDKISCISCNEVEVEVEVEVETRRISSLYVLVRRISCEKRGNVHVMQIASIYTVSGDCCLARLATVSQIGERGSGLANVPEHRLPRFAAHDS